MAEPGGVSGIRREDDVDRVAEEVAARLRARGVEVHRRDTPTDIAMLLDAVEDFELAVEARGGDLMTAEPPSGRSSEPTEFVLPERDEKEDASMYVERLNQATHSLRQRAD